MGNIADYRASSSSLLTSRIALILARSPICSVAKWMASVMMGTMGNSAGKLVFFRTGLVFLAAMPDLDDPGEL